MQGLKGLYSMCTSYKCTSIQSTLDRNTRAVQFIVHQILRDKYAWDILFLIPCTAVHLLTVNSETKIVSSLKKAYSSEGVSTLDVVKKLNS